MMKRHDSENRAIPATDAIDKAPQSARMAEDAQQRPTGSPSERERLKQLERENRELKRANEILRKAAAFFAQAELDRKPK